MRTLCLSFLIAILTASDAWPEPGEFTPPVAEPAFSSPAPPTQPTATADPPSPAETAKPKLDSGAASGMLAPGMGPPGYRAFWYPEQPVSGSDSHLGFVRQGLSVGAPIYKEGGDRVLLTAGVRHSLFFTDAILPDSGIPFPDQLWNVNVGILGTRQFDNGWSAGLSATFGSASDKPFHSIDEMNMGFFGFLRMPARNDRDAWIFSIMYSPVGNLNFPIPGIAYVWKPSDELNMTIGIPFFARWTPVEDLTLTFSYIPVVNLNAQAKYQLLDGWSVFGGFEWLNEAYFLADRIDRRERFLVFEKKLIAGVRWQCTPRAVVELNAGYAFDRYYGQGRNTISNLRDQLDVEPGAFVGISIGIGW
jgi:hypothetical protein